MTKPSFFIGGEMGRLDVRIRTRLKASVEYSSRDSSTAESVIIRELSLSGALVSGLSTKLPELLKITFKLLGVGVIELRGKVVRPGDRAAVRLFFSDTKTMQALWDYIKRYLEPVEGCPYCGFRTPKEGYCENCNMYLRTGSEGYLERHVENTFRQRLRIRLSRLNLEHFLKIIQFVDLKLLKIQHRSPGNEFVGDSTAMLAVFSIIRKVAPTDMNVLILGESGTGKELTARALHNLGSRQHGPFVAVNCAAIPETLLEAELFGHEKGAFTGAYSAKKGKFESADGGTLFLDEIGDLPQSLQAKLLRFLEDRLIQKIGSSSSIKVDVRIVAATNCDLQKSMEAGKFRPDLYYRLSSFSIKLPPLRERGEDVILLAKHFLAGMCRREAKDFSPEALKAMRMHRWPGNVRELHNKVHRGLLMASGPLIDPASMELDENNIVLQLAPPPVKETELKGEAIAEGLQRNGFVLAKTARELNISRPTLYALMRKYGITSSGKEKVGPDPFATSVVPSQSHPSGSGPLRPWIS